MKIERIDAETGEIISPGISAPEVETSATCGQIFGALAKGQGAIQNAAKSASSEAFKRAGKPMTYATLADVFDACREALAMAGVSVIQVPYNAGDDIGVCTILGHESGEWIKGKLAVKPKDYTAHGAGSVITYLRRYSLSAMVGVAPEDDDGNAASIGAPSNRQQPPQQRQAAAMPAPQGAGGKEPAIADAIADAIAEARELSNAIRGEIVAAQSSEELIEIQTRRTTDIEKIGKATPSGADWLNGLFKKRFGQLAPPPDDGGYVDP